MRDRSERLTSLRPPDQLLDPHPVHLAREAQDDAVPQHGERDSVHLLEIAASPDASPQPNTALTTLVNVRDS